MTFMSSSIPRPEALPSRQPRPGHRGRVDIDAAVHSHPTGVEVADNGIAEGRLRKNPGHLQGALIEPAGTCDDHCRVESVTMMQVRTGNVSAAFDPTAEAADDRV